MSDEDKKVEVAKIVAVVVDSGDFGFLTCGKCGYNLGQEHPRTCPNCGIKLEGVVLDDHPMGGSLDISH